MPKRPQQPTFNIVAKLTSWGHDNVAKVELLTAIPGMALAGEVEAKVAEDHRRLQLIDFSFRKKQGLRIGGAVLLRKSVVDEKTKTIVCREVDIMRTTEKEGPCIVRRNSAVFIHAPETEVSRVPRHATVASLTDAKRVKSLKECISAAVRMVEDMVIFGRPGILLTSSAPNGTIEELPIPFTKEMSSPEAVEDIIRGHLDAETLKLMAKSKNGWWMVPTFVTELEPEAHRQGKVAAQYANIEYGSADEPMWTRTNAVLRGSFDDLFLADVSPVVEPEDNTPALLIDLLPTQ